MRELIERPRCASPGGHGERDQYLRRQDLTGVIADDRAGPLAGMWCNPRTSGRNQAVISSHIPGGIAVYVVNTVTGKDFVKDPSLRSTLLGDGLAFHCRIVGWSSCDAYSEVTGAMSLTKITIRK